MAKNPLDGFGLPWMAVAGAAVGAYLPYLMVFKEKKKTMTSMEKAFASLLRLLLAKLEEQEGEIEKLRKRPTAESLEDLHREVERLRGENERLRKERTAIVPAAAPAPKRRKRS